MIKKAALIATATTLLISVFVSCTNLPGTPSSTASEMTCDDIAERHEGETARDIFGAEFEIIKVSNAREISRTDSKLVCEGYFEYDHGPGVDRRMIYELGEGGEWWYKDGGPVRK